MPFLPQLACFELTCLLCCGSLETAASKPWFCSVLWLELVSESYFSSQLHLSSKPANSCCSATTLTVMNVREGSYTDTLSFYQQQDLQWERCLAGPQLSYLIFVSVEPEWLSHVLHSLTVVCTALYHAWPVCSIPPTYLTGVAGLIWAVLRTDAATQWALQGYY